LTDKRLPLVAVLLAGGIGTRLWPLTRRSRPKQFLPLFGDASLFQRTYRRATRLARRSDVLVVAGSTHAAAIRRQAPRLLQDHLVLEAVGRNTAGSIALAALWIVRRHGDAVMVVLPSDHSVDPASGFTATLKRAEDAVRRRGEALVTIGIPPRSPDTGMGYIRFEPLPGAAGVRRVTRFIEKPPARTAARLLRSRRVLWNSGIFVWKASAILAALRRHSPDILAPLEAWVKRQGRSRWRVPRKVLMQVPAVPIDRAVLERSRSVLVVPASFRWSDVGTFTAVGDLPGGLRPGQSALGRCLCIDSPRSIALNPGGLSVLIGLKDIVAVRSGDTMLVCHRDSVQRVKEAVARLSAERSSRL
jgi:mannose-1-phosphate guanylyltransferase/mannose-6-phosphate isomerase